MAVKIIDGDLYDTRKSKVICKVYRKYSKGGLFFIPEVTWGNKATFYKAKNGTYFEYNRDTKVIVGVVEEAEMKDILQKHYPKKYMKMFKNSIKEA